MKRSLAISIYSVLAIIAFLCLLEFLWAQPATADSKGLPQRPLPSDVKLYASVDFEKVVIGERVRYSIVLEGNLRLEQHDPPPFYDR